MSPTSRPSQRSFTFRQERYCFVNEAAFRKHWNTPNERRTLRAQLLTQRSQTKQNILQSHWQVVICEGAQGLHARQDIGDTPPKI
jgi:hypothetical protein